MGMPITVEVVDASATQNSLDAVFDYFRTVDEQFSPYKKESELSRINRGEISARDHSDDMREVFLLAEKTKSESAGFFNIKKSDGSLDTCGIVKGWAIRRATELLAEQGFEHFYIDAGGDIQTRGMNADEQNWSVGIRNPFKHNEIVQVVYPRGRGVATSGTYLRGQHIYNPHAAGKPIEDVVSITVIGPDICEADRFATAAFAMGNDGVVFIDSLPGFEAYSIDANGIATMTRGFAEHTIP